MCAFLPLTSRPLHEGVDWNKTQIVNKYNNVRVALFTRAWIEIQFGFWNVFFTAVALFTRAWIEILIELFLTEFIRSPSSRGRGLKFLNEAVKHTFHSVALFTRAWIEITGATFEYRIKGVALFTRAWIEIFLILLSHNLTSCRPLHEGVDWNTLFADSFIFFTSRPLHEGVDWNNHLLWGGDSYISRPLHEGVDWNQNGVSYIFAPVGRPLHEGVDWNLRIFSACCCVFMSPSSRGRGLKYLSHMLRRKYY